MVIRQNEKSSIPLSQRALRTAMNSHTLGATPFKATYGCACEMNECVRWRTQGGEGL